MVKKARVDGERGGADFDTVVGVSDAKVWHHPAEVDSSDRIGNSLAMTQGADRSLVIGIAGGTGAGKTTIARAMMGDLPSEAAVYLQHDLYYRDRPDLSPEQRAAVNYDHPDSLETDLLVKHVVALRHGQAIERPNYDFRIHRRSPQTTRIEPAPVIVVEGILIFAVPELFQHLDIKVFIDTPSDIRILRRVRRDIEQRGRSFEDIRKQYYRTVRPMHYTFVEPTKYKADLVIPEGGNTQVAIDLLVGRVADEVRRRSIAG